MGKQEQPQDLVDIEILQPNTWNSAGRAEVIQHQRSHRPLAVLAALAVVGCIGVGVAQHEWDGLSGAVQFSPSTRTEPLVRAGYETHSAEELNHTMETVVQRAGAAMIAARGKDGYQTIGTAGDVVAIALYHTGDATLQVTMSAASEAASAMPSDAVRGVDISITHPSTGNPREIINLSRMIGESGWTGSHHYAEPNTNQLVHHGLHTGRGADNHTLATADRAIDRLGYLLATFEHVPLAAA